MGVEINEIGINLQVSDTNKEPVVPQQKIEQDDCDDVNREQIVDDCVRRTLQILKNLGGR
jgi:hypothetical protein